MTLDRHVQESAQMTQPRRQAPQVVLRFKLNGSARNPGNDELEQQQPPSVRRHIVLYCPPIRAVRLGALTRTLVTLVLAAGLGACEVPDRDQDDDPPVSSPTAPAPIVVTPPVIAPDRIEYRVLGTLSNVTIRHVNSLDGTTQVISDLPYVAAFSTTRDLVFLALDASAIGVGVLQVQIAVNGIVVREALSATFEDPRLSLAVTWRRGTAPLEASE